MTKEPEWKTLPAETPKALRQALRLCLKKDSKRAVEATGELIYGPQVLPSGNAVLFTLGDGSSWDDAQIVTALSSIADFELPSSARHGRCVEVQSRYMRVRFYVDPATGRAHIYDHDVSEEEVEEVLESPGEDRPGREDSRVAIGQTEAGRYLRVIYSPDPEPDSVFVITAYELKGKPLLAYRRRQRKSR